VPCAARRRDELAISSEQIFLVSLTMQSRLNDELPLTGQPALKAETGKTKDRLNGGPNSRQGQSSRRQQKRANRGRTLESEASMALRDQLIAELKDLNSAEQAADWAHRALASKIVSSLPMLSRSS
jgi:hypothetical protein